MNTVLMFVIMDLVYRFKAPSQNPFGTQQKRPLMTGIQLAQVRNTEDGKPVV